MTILGIQMEKEILLRFKISITLINTSFSVKHFRILALSGLMFDPIDKFI